MDEEIKKTIDQRKKDGSRYDLNIAFIPVFIILLTEFIVDSIQYGITTVFPILKILIPFIAFHVLRFNLKHSKNP